MDDQIEDLPEEAMVNPRPPQSENKPWISSRLYDSLKQVTQVGLPGFGALYFGLSQIWGLPRGEEVVGTVALVATFLGLFLNRASAAYDRSDAKYAGDVSYVQGELGLKPQIDLNQHPEEWADKKQVVLKVHKPRS